MKKSLVALAALAVAGMASAQSSVTLFGIVDASISRYTTSGINTVVINPVTGVPTVFSTPGQSQTVLGNSGYSASRLGFRGTEDLGGGLAASFWLEAPLSNDDGNTVGRAFNFSRRSTVSLSGGFGEVRLGRDYTPTFWNDTVFDPFGTVGAGANVISTVSGLGGTPIVRGGLLAGTTLTNGNYVRASNTVGYFLPPNLGGFYGQVQYGFDENVNRGINNAFGNTNSNTGRYVGGRFGYANGPLDVAVAYGESTVRTFNEALPTVPVTFSPFGAKVKTANLGAAYDFGVVKLFGELSQVNNNIKDNSTGFALDTTTKVKGFLLGATVPVGAGLIRASYSEARTNLSQPFFTPVGFGADFTNPKARKLAIGYVHNLSKRTALYATYAHVSNKGFSSVTTYPGGNAATSIGGVANGGSNGYDFGIRHSF
ncbi:MAG: porin [Variovorax sp.]